MGEEHVGSMVSVDCGPVLGCYEGCVLQVDSLLHTLTLKDPKRNGVVYPVAKVILRAADIHDLKIIKLNTESLGNNNKTPKQKIIHHSKSFQNSSNLYKNNNSSKVVLQRRRSQTPDPPASFEIEDDDYTNYKTSFNDCPGRISPRKHRASSGGEMRGNQTKGFNGHQHNNFLLSGPLDLSEMDDDFDFEANLALFDKMEVKHLCDSLNIPQGPKKNYRHDEFVIDNPADVYSSAKNTYKYLTEVGASVCSLTSVEKLKLFEQKIRSEKKFLDKFICLYSSTAVQCIFDAIGSKPSYESLAALLLIDAATSSIAVELANEMKIHLENRLIDVFFDDDEKALHSKKFDFIVCFGCPTNFKRVLNEIDQTTSIIVVEIDSSVDFCAKKTTSKFKSVIFWHLPVSDIDVKTSSVYLCDVGLPSKNVVEMFRLKKFQDPFGAKFFVKLLKM